jgi:hypothetical protein
MAQNNLFDLNSYGYPTKPETLIDATQLARATDPATSHQAAADVAIKLTKTHLLYLATLLLSAIPLTSQEIAAKAIPIDGSIPVQAAFAKRETLRKRTRELFDAGKITKCGSRICKVTGKESETYRISR